MPDVLNRRRQIFVDLLVDVDDHSSVERIDDRLERDAADDAVAQRLDDLAAFDDRAAPRCRRSVPQSVS